MVYKYGSLTFIKVKIVLVLFHVAGPCVPLPSDDMPAIVQMSTNRHLFHA